MKKLKYFFQNITILNIFLLTVIIGMIHYSVLPFIYTDIKYSLPAQKRLAPEEEINESEFAPPSPADYMNIAEDNLFHPERRIPPEKKVEPELPKPDFVLYGTMVSDDLKVAYLEDLKAPRSTPGRGKRQTAVKKGDVFSSFMLKEVETDKIVMVRGEEMIMVNVIDKRKKTMRESAGPADKKAAGKPLPEPQGVTTSAPAPQKAPASPQPKTSPKEKPSPKPPRSNFETTVLDFFDKSGKK